MSEPRTAQVSPFAMARKLREIDVANIEGRLLYTFPNNSSVTEPTYLGEKFVLDLAPGDDWLDVVKADKELTEHFSTLDAKALCFVVQMEKEDVDKLDEIDHRVMKLCDYSVTRSNIPWKHMRNGNSTILMNLVLEDSSQPTVLKFVENGQVITGTGHDFLKGRLNGKDLTDFACKPKVLLECVHDAPDYFAIVVTVLSVIFAPRLKRKIVSHTAVEEEEALRSAARFKYEF